MKRVVLSLCLVICFVARADYGDFFTIVVLPDTQYYTEVQWKTDQYFNVQTQWIVDHRADEHIAFVSHVGDLQQDGTFLRTDEHQTDPEVKELLVNIDPNNPPKNTRQWQRASAAMKILDDADVPYVACAGNHDFEHWGTIRNPVFFVKHFGPDRFAGKSWFGGGSPASSTMPAGVNTCQYFSAGGNVILFQEVKETLFGLRVHEEEGIERAGG